MKILYISKTRPDSSLNAVYIKGLRENGVNVEPFKVTSGGLHGCIEALNFLRHNRNDADCILIGFDSPHLAVLLRPFFRKKIIYIAFRPLYEGIVISRELASPFSPKAAYYWLLDFMAVHTANLTVVESDLQGDYFRHLFKVSGKKIFRNWIGVDGDKFYYDPTIQKPAQFSVLFRGALQPETGAEYAVRAAKLLEGKGVRFVMHVGGQLVGDIKNLINELKPRNLELTIGFLPPEKLSALMGGCHLSLGQLAKHDRLKRTVPHKAYESLAMKLPYLTASNTGILELLKDGETCITCNPADPVSLAKKILWAKNNYSEAERVAAAGYKLYQNHLTSRILAKKLLDRIKQLT